MYELIVLSLLMRQPAHGYLISKVINNIIGPIARASNGRIYPLLSRLEETGLIVASEEEQEGRQVRTYRITGEGRRRFRDLMMDTASNPKEYQEIFSFKVSVFPLITPGERLQLTDHYLHYCRTHVMHLQGGIEELKEDTGRYGADAEEAEALLNVLQHRLRQWELEIGWADILRTAIRDAAAAK
ncbi:MAG TPA: PadR family transcriptional regulator, partial [Symbiobacteriaceae bacterium]|nr:PadR family transcriptional regulator [Symbiobacteriaceae bacterium]